MKAINRREFLQQSAAAAAGFAALSACGDGNPKTRSAARQPLGEMTCRSFGGENVSLLGYGCMRWPFTTDESGNEVIDQEKVNALVDAAIEGGVNYFDTSSRYCRGLSEHATGIALSRHPREKWLIATKMSAFMDDLGDRQREETIRQYHESMRLLQVDYLDYFLLHGVGIGGMDRLRKRCLEPGLLDYFMEEREKGNIRHLGFSFHGEVEVFDYLMSLHDKVHWDMVQIQMNYADWRHAARWNVNAEYLYAELEKRGIPVVVMEPLRGGSLASLPEHLSARLRSLRPEDSAARWSFRYIGTHPGVMTILSGMTVMEHLQENLATFSPLEPCTESETLLLEEIATLLLEYPLVPCTNCQYCMPCPYGINIPAIFAHYNKCVSEGLLVTDPSESEYKRARRAYLVSYDRAIPAARQADHCIGCGACQPHCPQTIAIPDELHRIDRWVERLKLDGAL